ncbi:MAG: hypothetical protein EOP00_05555 [Pedobacter sp.]|nr:MAG: hypothetical protein EOP00_05555 [Pedobacter sp.]
MVSQELKRIDGNIEIKLIHGPVTGFLAKLFSKAKATTTAITIDPSQQKIEIDYSDGESKYEINFSEIENLIIHQFNPIEDGGLDYLVALILKEEPKYLSLYSFIGKSFNKELFQEIELMIFGKNKPSKVYTFEAAKQEFNL